MPEQDDALTRLVQQHVGRGRRLTFRAFEEQAVDPETGRRISKSTAENIVKGHQVKITPEIVRAVAAGIGEDWSLVRDAAIVQYIGYVATTMEGATAVDEPGATVGEASKSRAIVDRWVEEESGCPVQP